MSYQWPFWACFHLVFQSILSDPNKWIMLILCVPTWYQCESPNALYANKHRQHFRLQKTTVLFFFFTCRRPEKWRKRMLFLSAGYQKQKKNQVCQSKQHSWWRCFRYSFHISMGSLKLVRRAVMAASCCLALLLPLTWMTSVEWAVLQCGPGQTAVPTAKTMWPHGAQTTSKCFSNDLSSDASMHLECTPTCT